MQLSGFARRRSLRAACALARADCIWSRLFFRGYEFEQVLIREKIGPYAS
jgi:hypothetical protein